MSRILPIFFLFLLFALGSCTKIETYPITPAITFKSLQYRDTLLVSSDNQNPTIWTVLKLTFDVKDGDGDLGQENNGTTVPIDLYLTIWGKKDGVWIKDTTKNSYTIPYLTPIGQNKSVYATVDVESLYWVNNRNQRQLPYDSVKCQFYILDRAKHKSNIDSSKATIITKKLKY